MGSQDKKKFISISCISKLSSASPKNEQHDEENQDFSSSKSSKVAPQRKPGGWKAMPFILGNEILERLANIGLFANFNVFLLTQFHLDQVSASNALSIWSGVASFLPLVGAYISDAYFGRFKILAFASFALLMGMVTLTLIPWLPPLHPPPCPSGKSCKRATPSQMGVLFLALTFLSIGSSGIRPCNIPFGMDQFDPTTEEGRRGINSFFNWYYTSFTVVLLIALTLMVYIQSNVSWVLGFGIPTILMVFAIVLFFLGTTIYVHAKPEGSIFTGIAQGLVAAYKKRKLKIPDQNEGSESAGIYYDPPLIKGSTVRKLPLSNQFRFLNKGAMIMEGDLQPDGSRTNKWNLSSIQQIEELKCILRIIPVWSSGIIFSLAMQSTFLTSQALKMNRHLGPKFEIPVGSLSVISLITLGIWVPIYDRIIVPSLRKITKTEGGITILQRTGIGIIFSILSIIVAGLIERKRRASAIRHGVAISVMWLAPQLILIGFSEAFSVIAHIEFYNTEFPENMLSLGNCMSSVSSAVANYLSTALVNVIHHTTGRHGHPDWLTQDIDAGRIDYFYFLIAGLGVLNFVYFLYVASKYRYKSRVRIDEDEDDPQKLRNDEGGYDQQKA